ncbi:hypothetical protein HY409_02450 [Candidatus Gottesmanbacteria bacterium]|nr:hypothetical protein [Candidatus Gottesmanbacteria bacterium]
MIDDKTRLELAVLAREEGRSISGLVREFLFEKIQDRKRVAKTVKKISAIRAMFRMVKAAKKYKTTGPVDLARNHDKYIY